jgi:Flp pilus assembly protein TadB
MKTIRDVQITEAQEGPYPPFIYVRMMESVYQAGKWYMAHSQTRQIVELAALTLGQDYVRHCAQTEALTQALAKLHELRRAGTPINDALRLAAENGTAKCLIPK